MTVTLVSYISRSPTRLTEVDVVALSWYVSDDRSLDDPTLFSPISGSSTQTPSYYHAIADLTSYDVHPRPNCARRTSQVRPRCNNNGNIGRRRDIPRWPAYFTVALVVIFYSWLSAIGKRHRHTLLHCYLCIVPRLGKERAHSCCTLNYDKNNWWSVSSYYQ